jgi:hypothetical protein
LTTISVASATRSRAPGLRLTGILLIATPLTPDETDECDGTRLTAATEGKPVV